MFGEHSVWVAALRDILEVIPLSQVRCVLHRMSTDELMQKSILLYRLDHIWSRETVYPVSTTRHQLDVETSRVEVLPGGNIILTLTKKGAIQLHRTQDKLELVDEVLPPVLSYTAESELRRASTSNGEHWIVMVDYYISDE